MLENKETKNQGAIEERFCKPFESLPRHSMNSELTGMLIGLLLADKGRPDNLKDIEIPWLVKVIQKRVEICFDYTITDFRLLFFIALLSETPGNAVMYLTYIQYYYKKLLTEGAPILPDGASKIDVDLQAFCEIFPNGFPSKEDLLTVWDAQKVKRSAPNKIESDNLLDYDSALQSIRFN